MRPALPFLFRVLLAGLARLAFQLVHLLLDARRLGHLLARDTRLFGLARLDALAVFRPSEISAAHERGKERGSAEKGRGGHAGA